MDLADATVLVTGANGFVGGRVCRALADQGADVRAMVRRAGTAPDLAGVTEVVAALDDPPSVVAAAAGVTHVVHCAATAGPDLDAVAAVNVAGTHAVVAAAVAAGVARLVHVSTTSVNAEGTAVVDEDTPLVDDDANPYSTTKRDAEAVVAEAHAAGLATVVLRPPAVLGWAETSTWGERFPGWIRDGDLPMQPDPRANLGWVFVDDFAAAVALALVDPAAVGRTYTVANGTTTWGEYLGELMRWFPGCADPFVVADEAPAPRRWSSARITAELGWQPTATFGEAMAEAAAHHRG